MLTPGPLPAWATAGRGAGAARRGCLCAVCAGWSLGVASFIKKRQYGAAGGASAAAALRQRGSLAPRRSARSLRGGDGGPGAAAARPACAHVAAGRAACVGDARSCLLSLLFAAVAAAQVPPLHVQLAPIRPLRWLRGRRALRRGARLLRRPRAGADARGVADTLPLAAPYGDSGGAIGDTVPARRGGAYAAAQGARHWGASTAQALRLGVSQCGLALRLQRGAAARPPQRSTLDTSM